MSLNSKFDKPSLYDPAEIRTLNMGSSRSSDLVCPEEEGLTQQQFADETDINNIVKRDLNGQPIPINEATPQFADFGDATDYQTHQNYIAEANSAFFSLPAETRYRFKNDPAELLDFVQNPANQEEAIALGLATRRPEAPPVEDEPEFIPNPKKSTKNQTTSSE